MTYFFIGSAAVLAIVLAISWYRIAYKTACSGDLTRVGAPLVIFDFDGTICPSYPLFIEQVNFLADEFNLRKIEDDEIDKFRSMNPKSIMKHLGISMFKLPFFLKKARRNVQNQLLELKPVPGVMVVLQELKSQGFSLGILTSNSQENVQLYLQKYGMDFFDFVFSGNNIFGKDKHLKAILKHTHLNSLKDSVVYVGDEGRDMKAAKKTQVLAMGVTWGYNSLSLLQQSDPDFLCEDPSQILSFINPNT